MEDKKTLEDLRALNKEELAEITGGGDGDQYSAVDIMFGVDVINGSTKRREVFICPSYHTIPIIKNWIRKRENLGSCEIRLYNADNVELIDGSLTENKIKTPDVLTGIVSQNP